MGDGAEATQQYQEQGSTFSKRLKFAVSINNNGMNKNSGIKWNKGLRHLGGKKNSRHHLIAQVGRHCKQ